MNAHRSLDTETAVALPGSRLLLGIAVLTTLVILASLWGSAVRERMARLKADEIDQESRMVCERLGIPHDSERYRACADALSEVRRQEGKRLTYAAGIL